MYMYDIEGIIEGKHVCEVERKISHRFGTAKIILFLLISIFLYSFFFA